MHVDRRSFSGGMPSVDPFRFELDGKVFTLVPQPIWQQRGVSGEISDLGSARVVGGIEINGARHVVIVQAPSADIVAEPHDRAPSHDLSAAHLLTRREFEIALLVANGKCDKEIARALGISGYTVREHIRRTFAKLGVSRRAAIVSHVLRALTLENAEA